jgi:hypothetical protein
MHLRFFLQPAMSIVFAIRDRIREAQRRELLLNGWKGAGKVFLIAILLDPIYLDPIYLDPIYQAMEFRTFYPGEALMTAFLPALLLYTLPRGAMNGIAHGWFNAARALRQA